MQQILEAIKKSRANIGAITQGQVLKKEPRRVFIDLGDIGTGIILGREYLFSADKIKNLSPGDEIAVKIIGPTDENNFWELSLNQADKEAGWEKIRQARDLREILSLKII